MSSSSSRPSNPALSAKGRAWQKSTGVTPARRMMTASRGEQQSQVLAALGTDANTLTPTETLSALRKFPDDTLMPDSERMREVEMASLAIIDQEEYDDATDQQEWATTSAGLASAMPAARSLKSLELRERKRIDEAVRSTGNSNPAEARVAQFRKGPTKKKRGAEQEENDDEEEEDVEFVPTSKTMEEQDEAISAPGGMLEHTNMIVDAATSQLTQTQILRNRLMMKALMATLKQRGHAEAQANANQRPHDVCLLTPEWMGFVTRYPSRPWVACSMGAECFGMSLQPPGDMPASPLVVFHTPAQWNSYINTGHVPVDLSRMCVWCLALSYLSSVNMNSLESTSNELIQMCMPFRNPVDCPGGYINEFCYRPCSGSRQALLSYAIRAPAASHFTPVRYPVKRPLLNERRVVRRNEVGEALCVVEEVAGFAEIGDLMFRDGQAALVNGRRLNPEQVTHLEFQGTQWEFQLRTQLMTTPFVTPRSLRKTTETVVQQSLPEADLVSPDTPLRFVEENDYLSCLLDICLRPLDGALRVAQSIGHVNNWTTEHKWASWAFRHGLVIDRGDFRPKEMQPWDQLAFAANIGNQVSYNTQNATKMPAVSNHLFLYMVTARVGLLSTLDELLRPSNTEKEHEKEIEKAYHGEGSKEGIRKYVKIFSQAHMQAFEVLIGLVQTARPVDDVSLATKTPGDCGFHTFAEMMNALDMGEDEFVPPSPEMDPHTTTWIQLLQPCYPDDRHAPETFPKYVRHSTTVLMRPTPAQWIATHVKTLVHDRDNVADGEPSAGVEDSFRTHPPHALASLLVAPTLLDHEEAVQVLADVLEGAKIEQKDLIDNTLEQHTTFQELWAQYNYELPVAGTINTNNWTPKRMIHNPIVTLEKNTRTSQWDAKQFNTETSQWNEQVAELLAHPDKDHTVLLALVQTINNDIDALKTQSSVLRCLRHYMQYLSDPDTAEFVGQTLDMTVGRPVSLSRPTTCSNGSKVPAAGNARTRTSTQRGSVTAQANDKASLEYNRVRELARHLAASERATQFYKDLDAYEEPRRAWQNDWSFVDPKVHEMLMSRIAARTISRRGLSLINAERVYTPRDNDSVYSLDSLGDASAYVSANAADPIRMPPHPSVLNDDDAESGFDVDTTPTVEIAPLPLQSAFVSAKAFTLRPHASSNWHQTIDRLCAQMEQSSDNRDIATRAPHIFVLSRLVTHWQRLTHKLLTHAQSHFRLALLALDAPAMPSDKYFYQEAPQLMSDMLSRAKDDLYAMMLRNTVPRPTRFDLAEPMTLHSASQDYLPDASMLVASSRLFETSAQGGGGNNNANNATEARRAAATAAREEAAAEGNGKKKKKGAKKNVPMTTPTYDAWMAFLSRVMPQATYIVHGLDNLAQGIQDPSFMMMILRCLRVSLLSGYEYSACYDLSSDTAGKDTQIGPLPFQMQLELERLFVHAEDAAAASNWNAQVFGVWREFILANNLIVLAAAREFVLRMIECVPSCKDNVTRIYGDLPEFRRWVRLCATVIRADIEANNGTMVGIQRMRSDSLKGRDQDKGWSVFHTDAMATFATEEFSTWLYERVVAIQVQRATWRCVWGHVSEHCVPRVPKEDAQWMVTYVEMIPPGQHYQRHWLRDLRFDAYTVELIHRMYVTYPNVDRRHANFYLYMLPPHTLTTLALFFLLLSQHYINQVALLPPSYARQQQLAIREAFSIDDDEPIPDHLTAVNICSPLACYELLTTVTGRQNNPGRQSGVRENYETGELYCTSRNAQRNGATVPYEKVLTLENARSRYASQMEAHKHGKCTDDELARTRNELVGAADGVARTVVNNMFVAPCSSTPVLSRPGIGTVHQVIKKRKKRAMLPTEFARCTRLACNNYAIFDPTAFSTNGFLCQSCQDEDTRACKNPICVVCGTAISDTQNKRVLQEHNRRIASERRQARARISDRHDVRNMNQMHDVQNSFVSTDTKPHQVILLDDMNDHQPHVFHVCCVCWIRWMPDSQTYYTRSEFTYAARARCNHPAEKFPVAFAAQIDPQ